MRRVESPLELPCALHPVMLLHIQTTIAIESLWSIVR
jgi:hypothetical protein